MSFKVAVRKKNRLQRSALSKFKLVQIHDIEDRISVDAELGKNSNQVFRRHHYFIDKIDDRPGRAWPTPQMIFGFTAVIIEHDLLAVQLAHENRWRRCD